MSDLIQSARPLAHPGAAVASTASPLQSSCTEHGTPPQGGDPSRTSAVDQVLQAADTLIAAFGRHDRDAYFAAFSNDASFIFHHVHQSLSSREAYEDLWRGWERDAGFSVLACESRDRSVRMLDTRAALFTHTVSTTIRADADTQTLVERETIIFVLEGERWLAIHEHLSPFEADQSSEEQTA